MSSNKIPALIALIICVSLAGACTSAPSKPRADIQDETVSRWTRCIQNFSEGYSGPWTRIAKRAQSHCEGHRRDVVAIYPGHLKNRIESILSERAYTITTAQIIKTTGSTSLNASKGTQLDTLRMRLMEAQQADL